jgi:molybdate transport system ATP-binding protein
LSVRNVLASTITAVSDDGDEADLIAMDVGGASLFARITKAATRDLSLRPGMPAWALVKAVSLRGHTLARGIR